MRQYGCSVASPGQNIFCQDVYSLRTAIAYENFFYLLNVDWSLPQLFHDCWTSTKRKSLLEIDKIKQTGISASSYRGNA